MVDGENPARAAFAGRLKQQGIPCQRMASIPALPLALAGLANGLCASDEAVDG